jgi:ABC-2 type transport system ATP-binding protein/lipopolysaccharide transport system ATP-binding protein
LLTASEPQQALVGEAPEPIIHVDRVSVKFRVPRERIKTFKEYAIRTLQGKVQHEEFWALREVSLDVNPREVFGIVGRNGAGKSTLLRVVAGVFKPTRGRVRVQGRVAPLLELGAGFHAELTGRENVFLNGALLGYSKAEIQECFDEILDFAEIGDFIDAPIRTYSTGMVARLGFAVATAIRPDVLIVDEVLSVGDAPFQEKCKARIDSFRQQGACILLVAHAISTITEMCDRAIWLSRGQVRATGNAEEVARAYWQSHSSTAS